MNTFTAISVTQKSKRSPFFLVLTALLAMATQTASYVLPHKAAFVDTKVISKPAYTRTWETDLEHHIRRHIEMSQQSSDRPYMVAVCGIPGSGKSTSAEILAELLRDTGACIFPADGYHFSRTDLEQFPNPLDALYRRGAPETFDAASLIRDLTEIRQGRSSEVYLPGFDHAVGDPVEREHVFRRQQNQVVICEGLYLLHSGDGWEHVKDMFDYTVFVQADVDKCMQRLKIRNRVIPGYTPDEIDARVDAVDRVNALLVEQSKDRANLVARSAAA